MLILSVLWLYRVPSTISCSSSNNALVRRVVLLSISDKNISKRIRFMHKYRRSSNGYNNNNNTMKSTIL